MSITPPSTVHDGTTHAQYRAVFVGAAMVIAACLVLGGCRSAPQGDASFQVLAPAKTPTARTSEATTEPSDLRINYIAAYPRKPLQRPAYPQEALAKRAGDHVVVVTIVVNEAGRVSDVRPSMSYLSLRGPYSDLFYAAVLEALGAWNLEPARQVYWQVTPGKEDRYIRTETVAESMEVKFTFDAKGIVR